MKRKGADGRFEATKVFGVGIKDVQTSVVELGESYRCWRSMLNRCYSKTYQAIEPTYKNVVVAEEWWKFSNFHMWFNQNYRDGFDLDKDLLGDGTTYSPSVCVFVPRQINNFVEKKQQEVRLLPLGVRHHKGGKYTAQCYDENNKAVYLGSFVCPVDAFLLGYKPFKEKVARQLAKKWSGLVDQRVINALENYEVIVDGRN